MLLIYFANRPGAPPEPPAALPNNSFVLLSSARRGGGFYACSTSAYKLHYFETASGLRFVLTTDLAAADMREALRHIDCAPSRDAALRRLEVALGDRDFELFAHTILCEAGVRVPSGDD